jgi:membrane associated rhomboid family serine protease
MVWGIFPSEPGISYESHFFGAVIGVAMAVVCRNFDAARPEKHYRWEDESDDTTDPVIGDQWRGMDD